MPSSSKSSKSSSSRSSSSSSSPSHDPSSYPSPSSSAIGVRYEFTAAQNSLIDALARDMLWVAVALLVVGILYAVGLLVSVVRSFQDPHFLVQAALVGLAMLFYLALGTWTSRSARAFERIVTTRSRDIDHLMEALDNLRKMYRLVSLLIKIYVVFVGLAVIIGLIAALLAPFRA